MLKAVLLALLSVLSCTDAVSIHSNVQTPLSGLTPSRPSLAEAETCKQVTALFPNKHKELDKSLNDLYGNTTFQHSVFEALGAIVRVPSESYDDFGPVGQDPRWAPFKDLHTQLETKFPLVYRSLKVTKVNTYGLVFHWQGSNSTLKPMLMTAHQDVVPVEPSTLAQWIHPPYSGFFDGKWIWGRGTCDDKPDIISQLTSVDSLLRSGFQPTRTFVFAFGIDEESSGLQGAGQIAEYLENTYGHNSFAALLDEGYGFGDLFDSDLLAAGPATGEKGYLDVRVEVTTPGGHSSVPPRHTAIGILSSAIVAIESNPHPTALQRSGTAFQTIQCAAKYNPNIPEDIRELAERAVTDDDALEKLANVFLEQGGMYEAMMATTQAVDLVKGGVKVNALPEKVDAVVNHRIAEDSSVGKLQERLTSIILPVAKRYNLTLDSFGKIVYEGREGAGQIALSDAWGTALEPAPMTPVADSKPWDILSGTIQSALKSSPSYYDRQVVVVPGLALGNTDTQFYWNLTKHIFRYSHGDDAGYYNGAHTVNEAIRADTLIDKIRFHTKWILNWDEEAEISVL